MRCRSVPERRLDRVVRDDLSLGHDEDAVTDRLDDVHIVAAEDDGEGFLLGETPQFSLESSRTLDVQPQRGFVEEDDRRAAGEDARQRHFLFHPAGQFADGNVRLLRETELRQQTVVAVTNRVRVDAADRGEVSEVLADRQSPVVVARPSNIASTEP